MTNVMTPRPSTWKWISVYRDGVGVVWLPDADDQRILEETRLVMVERGILTR